MHKVHVGWRKSHQLAAIGLLLLVFVSLHWNSTLPVYAQTVLTANLDTFIDINEESSGHDNQDLVIAFSNFPSFQVTKRALIQFDLSGVTSSLTGVPLVLQLTNNGLTSGNATLTLYQLSDSWSATVTNDNAPSAGSSLQSITLAAGFTGEVRFTGASIGSYLETQRTGDGKASFLLALTTGSGFGTNIVFADEESGNGPQIEIPAPPTPTNTPVTPTNTPVTPTNTPVTPTNTPVTPTNTPMTPTNTPVTPTNTPVTPTNTPVTPTNTPVTPTNTPVTPTNTPVTPTPTITRTGTVTPATATATVTPVTVTPITVTPVPPTATATTTTSVETPTATATPITPMPTATETPTVPTSTATVPAITETATTLPPTATATTAPPTVTPVNTPVNTPVGSTPTPIVITVDPAVDATLTYTDPSNNSVLIQIPAGAVDTAIQLVLQPREPSSKPDGFSFIEKSFTLDAFFNGAQVDGFLFKKPVAITITYQDANIIGVDESSLLLYFYDEGTQQWVDAATTCTPPSLYDRNLAENHFTVNICHLTEFAVFGKNLTSLYLPLIQR